MNIVKTINFHKNINIKTPILSNFPSAKIQIDLFDERKGAAEFQ